MTDTLLPAARSTGDAENSPAHGAAARSAPTATSTSARAKAGPGGPAAGRFAGRTRAGRPRRSFYLPALLLTAALTVAGYLWNLSANGWANTFYAAAVQAGSENWEAFLFGSSDAANAITVDKPPASLWLMELSVRMFGLGTVQMLAPQVILAGLTVLVLGRSVRLAAAPAVGVRWSQAAAVSAAVIFALSPVAALMFRFNNPDALLVALMSAAVLCTQQAVLVTQRQRAAAADSADDSASEVTSRRRRRFAVLRRLVGSVTFWLVMAGVALGLGFLTKQLQVLLVAPGLAIAWLISARVAVWPRLRGLVWALAGLVVFCGWWIALIELLPASARPYVGGSQTNSFLELTFGYNGIGRLTGEEEGSVGGGNFGETSITRLLTGEFATQIGWLLPTALLITAAVIVLWVLDVLSRRRALRADAAEPAESTTAAQRGSVRGRGVRHMNVDSSQSASRPTSRNRAVLGDPQTRAACAAWGGWLVVTWLTLSCMSGIVHSYYTVALTPAIAAVIVIGLAILLAARRFWVLPFLAAVTALTAAWQFVLLADVTGIPAFVRWVVLAAGVVAALSLVALALVQIVTGPHGQRAGVAAQAAGRVAGNALPAAQRSLFKACRVLVSIGVLASLLTGLLVPGMLTVLTVNTAAQGSLVSVAGTSSMGGPGGGTGGGPGGAPSSAGPGGSTGSSQSAGPQSVKGPESSQQASQGTFGPGGQGGMGNLLNGSTPSAELTAYLSVSAGDYTWAAATTDANNAAGYQLATGSPVMAIGGYNGTDPSPTLAKFQALVAQHTIHFYIGSTSMASDDTEAQKISAWVSEHYTPKTVDGVDIYDLSSSTAS